MVDAPPKISAHLISNEPKNTDLKPDQNVKVPEYVWSTEGGDPDKPNK